MKNLKVPLLKDNEDIAEVIDRVNDILTAECPLTQLINGVIIEIELPANKATAFAHSLGKIPKYRLILKQEGNATFSDGEFTEKQVTFINHHATNSMKLTIFLLGG